MTSFVLKLIAAVSMLCDHAGLILFPSVPVLRLIGRLAFPIYAYLIVNGYQKTSSVKRYLTRLIAFAAISLLGLDETAPYEFIGSFGLGVAFGMVIVGMIFTSRYAARIREFKLRLLAGAREGKR